MCAHEDDAEVQHERKFLRVQLAKEVLCDGRRRKLYDGDVRACKAITAAAHSRKVSPGDSHAGAPIGGAAGFGMRECVRQRECVRGCDASHRYSPPVSEFSAAAEHRRQMLRTTCVERCATFERHVQ